MSATFKIIDWTPQKKRYDAVMLVSMILYLLAFGLLSIWQYPDITYQTIFIRATGTLALVMLHLILLISPLVYFFPQANVLLHNRRHLGVTTFLMFLLHAILSVIQQSEGEDGNWFVSLLGTGKDYFSVSQFPFTSLGIVALSILFVMAITSHNYWIKKLSFPTWKKLHLMVYLAYTLIVFYVLLGSIQDSKNILGFVLLLIGAIAVCYARIRSNFTNKTSKDIGNPKNSERNISLLLLATSVFLGLLLSFAQNPISSGKYDYGHQKEFSGFLKKNPIPHLRVFSHKNEYGEATYDSFILTGANKFGADKVLDNIIQQQELSMHDSLYVRLRGTLIYNDGKALLELTDGEQSFVNQSIVPDSILSDSLHEISAHFNPYKLETTLQGEIIDPKCYFGAMGSGKVYKSCAIRCISGGIPPVLKVSTQDQNTYYILYGENKQPVNQEILEYVAQPVEIKGHFEALDDWFVLYINPKTAITRL